MANKMSDPWDDIPAPGRGQRNKRRAEPTHPLDFFRARDGEGKHLFILEKLENSDFKLPEIGGIEVGLENSDDLSAMVLKLTDSEQVSIFRALCEDLLIATQNIETAANSIGANIVIARIKRWQELLVRRRNKLLSRQKIIGLVGELLILRDVMLEHLAADEGAQSWRGPYGDEQDFAVGGKIVEVKTQLSTMDQSIIVSSEAQLDTCSGEIVLVHQTIASAATGESDSRTLNELVTEIRQSLSKASTSAVDTFEAGLLAFGYFPRVQYDTEAWIPVRSRYYEITESFPKLTPVNIPAGISRIKYRIGPEACSDFERNETWFAEFLFDAGC